MKDLAFDAPVYLDGLLRLSSPALQTLRLTHLISGIYDEPIVPGVRTCGRPTTITGYTEWIDAAGSPATLGWDWEIRCMPGQVPMASPEPSFHQCAAGQRGSSRLPMATQPATPCRVGGHSGMDRAATYRPARSIRMPFRPLTIWLTQLSYQHW
ncbi:MULTISPECIES: DUF4902 domain-containing protein [unclassified Variovorax]|uniref:DUF4902 domain-containing protein n=1 Tax=Variovorax sp. WDL1 TaxID=207745 RepID=UPI000A0139E4